LVKKVVIKLNIGDMDR